MHIKRSDSIDVIISITPSEIDRIVEACESIKITSATAEGKTENHLNKQEVYDFLLSIRAEVYK